MAIYVRTVFVIPKWLKVSQIYQVDITSIINNVVIIINIIIIRVRVIFNVIINIQIIIFIAIALVLLTGSTWVMKLRASIKQKSPAVTHVNRRRQRT